MVSKLEGGYWMQKVMLPEHKEGYEQYVKSLNKRERIELDEQELEQISRALQASMKHKVPLTIRMYDPFENLRIVGVVSNISRLHGQFRVGDDWFLIDDIEAVEVDEDPC